MHRRPAHRDDARLGSGPSGDRDGGLVVAQYGKGTYIYTGYAFFRQIPAGVPGAVRFYVNLVSLGHGAN